MDYGSLIRRAWRLSWRHRFLWVLGLFVGGTAGSCSPGAGGGNSVQWQTSPEELDRIAPSLNGFFRQLAFALNQNVDLVAGLIIGLVVLALVLGLAFLVVSVIAQGGMAQATADLAMGRATSLGRAWNAGVRLFWRYLALGLLLIAVGIAIALFAAASVAVGVLLARLVEGPAQAVLIVMEVLLATAGFLVLLVAMLLLGVIIGFAQRAIALDGMGVMAGLREGLRLLRSRPGDAALAWLISIGLSILAGIAITVGVLLVLLPLGAIAFVLFSSLGPSLVPILYSIAGAISILAIGWLLAAIVNTYFWNYWTLVYLNFTGRLTERLEPQA